MKTKFNKITLLLIGGIFLSINVQSQKSSGGFPVSFWDKSVSERLTNLSAIPLPYINNEVEEQNANSIVNSSCNTCKNNYYGKGIDVSINIKSQGQLLILNDSSKLWTLKIESSTAYALEFYFDNFKLPDGATLYFYNEDKTMVLGAFTSANNPMDESKPIKFGTQFIKGKNISIEYHEPKNADFEGELSITKIIHVFKYIFGEKSGPWSPDGSGTCNINVSCPEGSGWENEIKSVVLILGYDNDNQYKAWCSGALINNTAQDGRSLLLTANHCIDGVGPMYDYSTWTFLFNHQSTDCNSNGSDVSGSLTQSVYGSILLASDGTGSPTSDYLLLDLNASNELADYGACLAGWSLTANPQPPVVGIHHPSGDIKKISIEYHYPISSPWIVDLDPNCTVFRNTTEDHWKINDWEKGTTEYGSSGSPLFDNNHKIIGQLHGGCANCSNSIRDFYGKLTTSWQQGGFSFWLDPNNSGATSLGAYCPTNGGGGGGGGGGDVYDCTTKLSRDGFQINGEQNGVTEVCLNERIKLSPTFPHPIYPDQCSSTLFPICSNKKTGKCSEIENENNALFCESISIIHGINCECTFWQLFIAITECNYNLSPISTEYCQWVNLSQSDVQNSDHSFNLLDYLPGGSLLPGRNFSSNTYAFGFNGKLKDDEIKGNGNSYDFGDRMYDPRVERWFKRDLKSGKYPFFSPYVFVADNPIYFVDPDGKDLYAATKKDQRMVLNALKSAFGSNHGFKFDENGKLNVDKDIYYDLDNDLKKVLYEHFVNDIVNNTCLELHAFYTDEAVNENNQEFILNKNGNKGGDAMEISWTVFFPWDDKTNSDPNAMYGRIYVGTMSGMIEIDKKIGGNQQYDWANKPDNFWHGIGHQITNFGYKADTRVPQDLSIANKLGRETMGFENLFRAATNKILATGKGQHTTTGSGSDDSILKEKPKGDPNPPTSYKNPRYL